MVEWIPVEERLPENGEFVLIITKRKIKGNGAKYTVALAIYRADDDVFENDSCLYGEVVAWMSTSALFNLWIEN